MRRTKDVLLTSLSSIAVGTLVFALQVVLPMSVARAESESGVFPVGTLPLLATDQIVSDPIAQRIIAFGPVDEGIRLRIFDSKTLEPLSGVVLDSYSISPPAVYAFNQQAQLLYVLANPVHDGLRGVKVGWSLLVIDQTLALVGAHSLQPVDGLQVRGLTYEQSTRLLYMALDVRDDLRASGQAPVQVAAYDPVRSRYIWPAVTLPVAGCSKLMSNQVNAPLDYNANQHSLFLQCLQPVPHVGIGTMKNLYTSIAAIKVADPSNPTTTLYRAPGDFDGQDGLVDHAAGRMLMISKGYAKSLVWVFDEEHRRFVGAISAGDILYSFGVNGETGQFYAAARNQGKLQIVVASDRGLHLPQPTPIAIPPGVEFPRTGFIRVLNAERRFVVPLLDSDKQAHFQVYADGAEPFVEITEHDPDLRTIDVNETAGVTDATFSGNGQAYGVRVHEVGGVNGILQGFSPRSGNWWAAVPIYQHTGLTDGDYDLTASFVPEVGLDDQGAAARATSQDADENTRNAYARANNGKPWPHVEVSCADLGQGRQKHSEGDATVECDAMRANIVASATNDSHALTLASGAAITFGSTASSVRAYKDSLLGSIVRAEAVARDIVFVGDSGTVSIGKVTSIATTQAHGRPDTARARLQRTFENVHAPGYTCTTACDPRQVLASINAVFGGYVRVDQPAATVAQTPKGARATVVIDPWQLQEDTALTNQDPTQLQVSALRVSVIGDFTQPSRLVFDFAGVAATANYNIYRLGSEVRFETPPAAEPPPQLEPIAAPPRTQHPNEGDDLFDRVFHPGHGWAVLMTLSAQNFLLASMWAVFAFPAFIASRRRHLNKLRKLHA